MGETKQSNKKPLFERIKDRLRDLNDELVGALEGLVQPEPRPIPIPVRR